jgi:hypothetical protein
MMRIHSLGRRVVAAILFASHSLLSCSTPQLDKQSFQDTTPRPIMDVSKASSSSTIEEQPTLSQASNNSSIGSELEIHAAPSSQALEAALQEPVLVKIPEGKEEINPPVGLPAQQAPSQKPRSLSPVNKNSSTVSNSNQAEKEVSRPASPKASQERNEPRLALAHTILSITGAETDVRLSIYYHLASQLYPLLKEHADLKGGWNLLWQKAQEPELLVNKEAYYKKVHPEAFKRLEAALEEIQLFKVKLATYEPDSLAWQKDLAYLATFYKKFKEKLIQASLSTKDTLELYKLLEPKALLDG